MRVNIGISRPVFINTHAVCKLHFSLSQHNTYSIILFFIGIREKSSKIRGQAQFDNHSDSPQKVHLIIILLDMEGCISYFTKGGGLINKF